MTNWCENTLTVPREEKDIKRFKKLARPKEEKGDLSLESVYPIPEEIKNTMVGSINIDGHYVKVWRETEGRPVVIPQDELDVLLKKIWGNTLA
jgi:hypothetical protein